MGRLISEKYAAWQAECEERFQQLKKNEEELNRIFIDIYGLQDELTPDVADKDVTVHRVFDSKDDVPESMKGSNYVRTMRDEIVSLISYAVGCMFGRYSLDVDGLAYAGGDWDASKYKTIIPDSDNIIPICDDEYFDDDITGRFVEFVRKVYGDDKGTLSIEHIYDYLIVDEASQVDLATGVLAFSCARNIVIVGDLKQLPNVLTEDDIRTSDAIWQKYSLDERYRFSTHSLLSSALEIWQDAPVTLLREHYRCHPKIINFCNQKFYHGQLIVMTKDHDEPDVLTMYRTTAGNHARGHLNQRQIDVIQQEVLPRLHQQNFQSIGIITPYRDQVTAIRKQLGDTYEVDTVHKFQGREQDAIILTSVDNVITDFVDDPHMLNVAVSRAVHSLAVVTSQDPRNDQTNYGDLARYIEYNNFEIIQSQIYSVFDMLYQGYAEQRREYLQKHKRVSEYDSENLMHSVIQEILSDEPFSSIGCAVAKVNIFLQKR